MKRIPTLAGWRGRAIAMVLWDHFQAALHGSLAHPWRQTGQHGVTIFFVLSGLLITSKLIAAPSTSDAFTSAASFASRPSRGRICDNIANNSSPVTGHPDLRQQEANP